MQRDMEAVLALLMDKCRQNNTMNASSAWSLSGTQEPVLLYSNASYRHVMTKGSPDTAPRRCLDAPPLSLQDLGEGRAADTPVTRLEKEMKHNAGMDGVDDAGSQWRTIASRVVHGQGVKHAQPNTTAFYPPSTPDRPEALGHVGSPGRFKRVCSSFRTF